MTPFHNRQTPITQRMVEDMLVRNLSVRTIDTYTYHVDRFARHFGKLPVDLGPEQIREFQLWLIQVNQASWSQFNQAVCSLRFLYTVTLPRPWSVAMISFGKRPKKLPTVLGQEEVHDLISSFVTTMIYLHRRRQHLGASPSPLDWLPIRQCPRWIDPTVQGCCDRPRDSLTLNPKGSRLELSA